jgi:hypothetical protein
MTNPTPPICPRCRGFIPNNDHPGEYEGALSRLTRTEDQSTWVFICSACGLDEAMGRGLIPQAAWPLLTATSIPANLELSYAEEITAAVGQLPSPLPDREPKSHRLTRDDGTTMIVTDVPGIGRDENDHG